MDSLILPTEARSPTKIIGTEPELRITQVDIYRTEQGPVRAFVNFELNRVFLVRGAKVVEQNGRLTIAMPTRTRKDGKFVDVAHPLDAQTREKFEGAILRAYADACAKSPAPTPVTRG